jgi:GT2 family glycosyltransferase
VNAHPELSVVVASYNSSSTIRDCLRSLREQVTRRRFEVIVVDSSCDATGDLVAAEFPEARLLRFAERKFPGAARNQGVAAAGAGIVSFVDADCVAPSDYVEQVLAAHENPAVAIGGAIANHEPANLVAWAAYLCEFTEWMPGAPARPMENIATANLSYKRLVFEKYGRFLEGTYGSDTDFNWRLGREGHRLLWLPSISVSHRSIGGLWNFLRHEFNHGKDCARMRARGQRFSRGRRWLYAACFPLIALKLFAVIAFRNVRNRIYLARFLQASPLVAAGLISWSLGELVAFVKPLRAGRAGHEPSPLRSSN